MDRQIIAGMVEDYWRAAIPAMQNKDVAAATDIVRNFDRRISETVMMLPPIEAAAFQQAIEAERERLLQEYRADPTRLKKRLGLELGVDAIPRRQSKGLGDLAVKTAVRASVWEAIWALFRLGRR